MTNNNQLKDLLEVGNLLDMILQTVQAKAELGMLDGDLDAVALADFDKESLVDKIVQEFCDAMGDELAQYISMATKAKPIMMEIFEREASVLENQLIKPDETKVTH